MMNGNLQIHFKLGGENYDIGLNKTEDIASPNKITVGGSLYSIQGSSKAVNLIKDIFANISEDSTGNLSQIGKELKAKLWSFGAKDINLSAADGTHKIGLKNLKNETPINIRQTIKDVSSFLEQKYVFPDVAKKCSEYIHLQLQNGAYDAITDLESFAEALTADLHLISEDKHIYVYLKSPPRKAETNQIDPDFTRPLLISKSEYKATTNNESIGDDSLPYELQVGILAKDPTIGYMDLNVFGVCKERNNTPEMKEDVASRKQAYIEAVGKLKGVDTIIIDLRNNGGGDPSAVQLLCSLFIDEGLPLNRIEWRTEEGLKSEDFNTLSNKELPKENRLLDKKIYVLIGPKTFSAAEEFSNNMKVLGRATFVGEPSGGGAHPGTSVEIDDDLEMFIPTGRAINPIQQGNWEGVGIIPDHMVQANEALDETLFLIDNIALLKEKLKGTLPREAGAVVLVYERGKQLNPICIGQTSATGTLEHDKVLLNDKKKQLEILQSNKKEFRSIKTQEKIDKLKLTITLLEMEISAQENAKPVDMQTSALIGSGAKMFTALLSKVLCEKGYLSLQNKLSDFLGEEHFQIFENPELAKQITLEMLLSHTSGLQYFSNDNDNSREGQSLDAIFGGMPKKGIRFNAVPGDNIYSYSNHIELAALFIEKSYKKKLVQDLIEDKVFSADQPIKQLEEVCQKLQEKIKKTEELITNLKNGKDQPGQLIENEELLKTLKLDLEKTPKNIQELLKYPSAYIQDVYVYQILDELLVKNKKNEITYADIMKKELLDPLEMTRTSFEKPKDSNVLRAFEKGNSSNYEILDPLMQGAGGLWSCMADMAKLVEAYREDGLQTSSGIKIISPEGLQDLAKIRGVNGNTGLGLNIDGSILGKGGSVSSYEFTLKMDPSRGNAIISMCNFSREEGFSPFAESIKNTLDGMYPKKEVQEIKLSELTEKERTNVCPMEECDIFAKGDRGYVGLKFTDEYPGINLNWNGQTLPVRKLEENRYLILDKGGYPDGQILQIFKGKITKKSYIIIEKGNETNAFQQISKTEMFFPENTNFMKDIIEAKGSYPSTKGGPTFKFDIDFSQNCCKLSTNKDPAVTALVTKIVKDKEGKAVEVFLQGNCGPVPPDKIFKISKGEVVRTETQNKLELQREKLSKEVSPEEIAMLEKGIADLEKQLLAQQDVAWFFRVADFVNPDNIAEEIPLPSSTI